MFWLVLQRPVTLGTLQSMPPWNSAFAASPNFVKKFRFCHRFCRQSQGTLKASMLKVFACCAAEYSRCMSSVQVCTPWISAIQWWMIQTSVMS